MFSLVLLMETEIFVLKNRRSHGIINQDRNSHLLAIPYDLVKKDANLGLTNV